MKVSLEEQVVAAKEREPDPAFDRRLKRCRGITPMDSRLAEQRVAQGTFPGDPGNPHPPVHRYEFSAGPEADRLTVTSGGIEAAADLGDAPEVWVDVAYYGPGRVEVTVYDEPVLYG